MMTTSNSGKHRRLPWLFTRRYRPKSATSWGLAILVVLALVLSVVVALLLLPPRWYRPIHQMNDAVYNRADHAQASLMALRNQLRNPRTGAITWTITQREVNSLLAVAYGVPEKSKKHRHPSAFTDPYVHFTNNQITFAARDSRIPGNAVVSVTISVAFLPAVTTAPQARIDIRVLRIGSFPLPTSWLTARLQSVLPRLSPMVRKIIDVYAGPRYADVAAPQIVHSISAILTGKTFPTELRLKQRRLVMRNMSIHGPLIDASGRSQPAALTFELVPEK
ncbi:MAG: hypothetical protein ACP5VQ_02370 [Phycisphaerae bacterium]